MKKLMSMLACMLVWSGTCLAANSTDIPETDICSLRFSDTSLEEQVRDMNGPIKEAVVALDNAKVTLPSPSLASGTITYLSITPNFLEHIENVCVLGYFSFTHNDKTSTMSLQVDHTDVVKTPRPDNTSQTVDSTRIYFRVPNIEDFQNADDLRGRWKFWKRNQTLHLKVAAFHYYDGKRGSPYFGDDIPITVSSKPSSIFAALLFTTICYLAAATAIPSGYRHEQSWMQNRCRSLGRRLLPWHITGGSGQASLSQLQMLLFTLIVATLLFYQWLRTGLLQELSVDLLYLVGLSIAGAAGSEITSSIKKELDPALYRYAQLLGWFTAPPIHSNRHASAADLLMTNKRFDIYKFQMLVFTIVIAAYVIAAGADQLGNIQISATLLTLMGMSQGAYVGGRATSEGLTPLQDQLRGMQNLQERYQASTDPKISEELRRRYLLTATQTAALFGSIFARTVPDYLLEMPFDVTPDMAEPAQLPAVVS